MRVQIGSFQFRYEDTIEHSKFLKMKPAHISDEDKKVEYFKRKILSSYSTQDVNQIKDLLQKIGKILNYNTTEDDLFNFANEMVITKNKQMLPHIDKNDTFFVSCKGQRENKRR